VVLDEKGRILSVAPRERLEAHRLIEDFMIAANVAAAKALEAKKAPVMYRDHEPPSREKLVALKDYLDTFDIAFALGQVVKPATFNHILERVQDPAIRPQVMEQVLRSQTQAYYAPANTGISGSRLAATRISPARSGAMPTCSSTARWWAPGGWSRRCARRGCRSPMPSDGPARRDDQPRRAPRDGGRARDRRPLCRGLSRTHVGQVLDTRITGVRPFGFFATVTAIGGDGLVPVSTLGTEYFRFDEAAQALVGEESGDRYASGQLLKLRLVEADPISGALRFEPVEGAANGRRGAGVRARIAALPGAAGRARIAARRDDAAGRETSATADRGNPSLTAIASQGARALGSESRCGGRVFCCARWRWRWAGSPRRRSPARRSASACPIARAMSGIQLYGNAWTWWEQAGSRYRRGQTPRKGAVLVFRPNGVMQYGHVAVVSQVIGPGVLMVTHSNWSRIGGTRGQVERDVTVTDISPARDWSRVRVWYHQNEALGGKGYPTYGFIYGDPVDERRADRGPLAAAERAFAGHYRGGDRLDWVRGFPPIHIIRSCRAEFERVENVVETRALVRGFSTGASRLRSMLLELNGLGEVGSVRESASVSL
jgi:hypothetical protein